MRTLVTKSTRYVGLGQGVASRARVTVAEWGERGNSPAKPGGGQCKVFGRAGAGVKRRERV